MKYISRSIIALILLISASSIFAESSHSITARLQAVLEKQQWFEQKEALINKIESKLQAFEKQGKKSPLVSEIRSVLREIQLPFALPKVSEVNGLNTAIQSRKITLQARAHTATPVFYTGSLSSIFGGKTGTGLLLDEYNQIDPLETIALSGTTFHIVGVSLDKGNIIYRVTSPDYPYPTEKGYYIDARFVDTFWMPVGTLVPREKKMPEKETILKRLRDSVGLRYVWGGDVPTGIPLMLQYYAPTGSITDTLRIKWTLTGVDCSGLLYAATDGSTPRNTSDIVEYGTGIKIAGKTVSEIIPLLKPLDVIAWKGHMMIVLNQTEVIQSRADYGNEINGVNDGVRIRPLKDVLTELLDSRIAVNSINDTVPEGKKKFVIRRWY